jgi:hypothetical protein
VRILQLRLNEFARVRFVRGGLPVDQIQVKATFVPDPGPRSGSASRSRAQPTPAANTYGMSDLFEPSVSKREADRHGSTTGSRSPRRQPLLRSMMPIRRLVTE